MDDFESTKEILYKFPAAVPLRSMLENGTDSEKAIVREFLDWELQLPAQLTFESSSGQGRVFITHAPARREYYRSDAKELESYKVNYRVKDRDTTDFRKACPIPYDESNIMDRDEYAVF